MKERRKWTKKQLTLIAEASHVPFEHLHKAYLCGILNDRSMADYWHKALNERGILKTKWFSTWDRVKETERLHERYESQKSKVNAVDRD